MKGNRLRACLALLALAVYNAECYTQLTATPTTISPTTPLSVRCDYQKLGIGADFDALVSLSISREDLTGGSTEELASLTTFRPTTVNTATGFTGTAQGDLSGISSPNPYLQILYPTPTQEEAGEYICIAQGVDSFGHPMTQTSNATVQYTAPVDTSNLQAQINQLTNSLQQCQAQQQFDANKLQDCQTQQVQLSDELNKAAALISKLAQIAPQADADIVGVSKVYDSDTVYMLTSPTLSLDQAKTACAKYGGYIAEINDEQEYQFVSNLLKDPSSNLPSNVNALITGAFYPSTTSPFQFLTNTGDPVYTGHWFAGEPDRLGPPNTWLLIYNINGQLGMADGPANGDTRTFVCEVSSN